MTIFPGRKHRAEIQKARTQCEFVGQELARAIMNDNVLPPYAVYGKMPRDCDDVLAYAARLAYGALDVAGQELKAKFATLPVHFDGAASEASVGLGLVRLVYAPNPASRYDASPRV